METKVKRRARNYLINRRMQLRLTFKFIALTVSFCLVIGILVYHTIWPVVSGFVPLALINQLKGLIFYRLFYFSIPLLILIMACCIVFTHKIAGPIYNMENKLEQLLAGETPPLIILRKGDELQELADKLNSTITKVKEMREANTTQSKSTPKWLKQNK
jgi:methyl-accepting chemotaxis protein